MKAKEGFSPPPDQKLVETNLWLGPNNKVLSNERFQDNGD